MIQSFLTSLPTSPFVRCACVPTPARSVFVFAAMLIFSVIWPYIKLLMMVHLGRTKRTNNADSRPTGRRAGELGRQNTKEKRRSAGERPACGSPCG